MNRRGFLAGILAAGVAPAVIGCGVLMPVKEVILPKPAEVWRMSGPGEFQQGDIITIAGIKGMFVVTGNDGRRTINIADARGRASSILV